MKNLVLRSLTGILFVALLVGCIVGGDLSFFILFNLVTLLTVWEFCHIINKSGMASINPIINVVGALLIFWTFRQLNTGEVDDRSAMLLLTPYLTLLILLFVFELFRNAKTPIQNWAFSVLSHVYIGLPFGILCTLAYHQGMSANGYDFAIPLAVFIFLWTNDTGAYCTGSLLHKYFPAKLFPRISPAKTWVGSIGGGVLCLVAAWIMSESFARLTLCEWIGFGLVVCIFGTLGDLVESLMKRKLGIKDSGHILPGHGGMLDRFDSSLLAIPASAAYFGLIEAFARL